MKKIFSIILALTLVMSLSVSSLAMYTFKTVEDDGTVWIYHFDAMDKNATDAGIFLNGVKYNLDGEGGTKASAGETALADAKASGVYGIGFNVTNYQKESYSAQPYYTLNGEDVKGEVENIELNITPYEQVATLSSIKITHSSISDYTVNLKDGVYNYYVSNSDVGLSGNVAYVNSTTTATTTVEGATITTKTYLTRRNDAGVVGKTFEYTVTALDGITTKKYVVQIANDGYIPTLADTYVDVEIPNENYGVADKLVVREAAYSLIKFYIGNIDASNSNVNLNVMRTSSLVNDISICKVASNDWDELTYTPATAGSVVIGDEITTLYADSILQNKDTVIDITNYVVESKKSNKDYITLALTSTGKNGCYFTSKEGNAYNVPFLTVTAAEIEEKDNDATIQSLVINGVNIDISGFDSNNSITHELEYGETIDSVVATANSQVALVGNAVKVDDDTYTITITAEDGSVKTYTVNFTWAEDESMSDATLSLIKIAYASTVDYTVNLEDGVYNYYIPNSEVGLLDNTAYVNATTTATTTIEGATVASKSYITRLAADNKIVGKTFEYTVTALDGITTKKYVVQIANDGYIPVVEDTYVNTNGSQYETSNYGANTNLIVKSGVYSLVKFYIGNIDSSNISKVNLNLVRDSSGVNDVNVCKVASSDWDELTYTPATAGSVVIGDTIATVPSSSIIRNEATSVDITQYVLDAKNEGKDYITIGLQSSGANSFYFASKEKNSDKYMPRLTVIYNTAE